MSKIFDNIETKFEEGLHAILTNVGVERAITRHSQGRGNVYGEIWNEGLT